MPFARCQFVVQDDRGNVVPGAEITVQVETTGAPLATIYSDRDGAVPLANPFTIGSDGLVAFHAAGGAYRITATSGAFSATWRYKAVGTAQEFDFSDIVDGASILATMGGRLTLTSGQPVTAADVTAATTLYYTPATSNQIALHDGLGWKVHTFAEFSLNVGALAAATVYDLFVYDQAGTVTFDTPVAWTNDTTRATALAFQDGVAVKAGATTRRYVGTIRTVAAGQTEDSKARRFVWNEANAVPRRLWAKSAGGDDHSYTSLTPRLMNNNANYQIFFVVGRRRHSTFAFCTANAGNSSAGTYAFTYVGFNSTSGQAANSVAPPMWFNTAGAFSGAFSFATETPEAGLNYFAWLQSAGGGTCTWYPTTMGIVAQIWG